MKTSHLSSYVMLVFCALIFVLCGSYLLSGSHLDSQSNTGSELSSTYQPQGSKSETGGLQKWNDGLSKSDSNLLEIGHASKLLTPLTSAAEVKVVSFNIRWRGGQEIHQLAKLFKDDPDIGSAAILGLQEVDRNKERTGNENTARILAQELGMYYAWAAPGPPAPETWKSRGGNLPASATEEETGVVILSRYPLSNVQRIVLPHEGPGGRRRVALGATITVGPTSLRIYSVHSETRIPVDKKLDQMKAVLEDLRRYGKDQPVIVMGDFNTWEQDAVARTFDLFKSESFSTPFDDQATFSRRVLFVSVDLKLDWIWLKNLAYSSYGVNRKIALSDHWPLWILVRTKKDAR